MTTKGAIGFVYVMMTTWGGTASADEPVCNKVLPKRALAYYAGKVNPSNVCYPGNALAADEKAVGLDYAIGSKLITFDSASVSGCIIVEFQLAKQFVEPTTLSSVTITAKPTGHACAAARSQCAEPYCGTGQSFVVFARAPNGPWKVSKSFEAKTPNWSEYKVDLLGRYSTDSIMICRTANGPARDDIAIDAVSGCAFRTN